MKQVSQMTTRQWVRRNSTKTNEAGGQKTYSRTEKKTAVRKKGRLTQGCSGGGMTENDRTSAETPAARERGLRDGPGRVREQRRQRTRRGGREGEEEGKKKGGVGAGERRNE